MAQIEERIQQIGQRADELSRKARLLREALEQACVNGIFPEDQYLQWEALREEAEDLHQESGYIAVITDVVPF